MLTSNRNTEKNGLEISFEGIPDESVRTELKNNGFRWHRANKFWYAKETPERLALVERLCGKGATPTSKKSSSSKSVVAPVSTTVTSTGKVEMNKRCCYSSSLKEFFDIGQGAWLAAMKSAFSDEYVLSLGTSQEHAWKDCYDNLQKYLPLIDNDNKQFGIIFEYALPYESGRRPDVLLVSKEQVIILEFKMKNTFLPEDIDQVAAYARDIREYHYESRDKVLTPVLVLTKTTDEEPTELPNGVITVSADYLPELVDQEAIGTVTPCDLNSWMDSKYEPLPTIVDAAKMFMKHEELPNIRRVNSTGIPDAIRFLKELTDDAKENQKHVLALVTGVPGAGKTFLGLQYVYDVCESNENANSVYLSGNGPLIKVLTDALNSNVFVKSIHTVVNEYIAGKAKGFNKNILVFDEGQRAWDKQQMSSKRRTDKSEPDVLVELADEELDWAVLLILVGEGQEINNGENSGLAQWNIALNRSYLDWEVVCPEKLVHIFEDDHEVIANDNLNLNTTLRSYLASDVSKFVNLIIDGDISGAKALSDSILAAGFNMYVTRDLNAAKNYCINRYAGNENKRYGLMASSKAYNLSSYRMKPQFQPDVAAWFNRAPSEAGSCCQLSVTVSEFDCQGLEVDMPIVGWGTDMLWDGSGWAKFKDNESADSDANTYRINSYRVLLTRGRDGFIAFVPDETRFDATYNALLRTGIKEL